MLDNLINLDQIIRDVQNGRFDNVVEISQEFIDIINLVHKYKRDAKIAFYLQSECKHESFKNVKYHLNRNLMSEYFYTFKKDCATCGKGFHHNESYLVWNDKLPAPEGYEGASLVYYNLDI
jgi:hypothetical protein